MAVLPIRPCLFICGPTASGKSELAIDIAQAIGGEVIGLDSVQVYKEANIGSAKLHAAQMRGIPHHLIDIVSPDQDFDVAKYVANAIDVAREVQSRGNVAIFCGGSNLYLTSLIHGLANLPEANRELRIALEKLSSKELYSRLQELDPERAHQLHQNDRFRVIRAVESCMLCEGKVSGAQKNHGFEGIQVPGIVLVKLRPRHILYSRINSRAQAMVDQGLIEEVQALRDKYGTEIKLLKALGYAQVIEGLHENVSEQLISERIAQFTRNYAKRQIMFWRNEPQKRGWKSLLAKFAFEPVLIGAEQGKTARRNLKGIESLILNESLKSELTEFLLNLQGFSDSVGYLPIVSDLDLVSDLGSEKSTT